MRVAGSAPQPSPAGDTLPHPDAPFPGAPGPAFADAGAPRDELAAGPGPSRRPRAAGTGRKGLRVAAVAAGAAVVLGGGAVAAFAMTGGDAEDGDKATVASSPLNDAAAAEPTPRVDPKVLEAARKKLALERASKQVRTKAKAPALRPKGTPIPTKKPDDEPSQGGGAPAGDPVPAGEAQRIAKALMPNYGFSGDGEFGCLVKLWNKESHWNVHADNPSSEAYGIPQANPGSKMASAGPDWRNNPTTQIKWGLGYIKNRYGTPCGAWSHSQRVGWY
ncbi:hypothetical protein [Spirillospora albida]|uniref:aggregation-promoting factor C-terminal-like domain-containing protein n=1 Tax=Spirillospora albida TaxID=58123 RepID=UPI000690F36C|nr:hypothetical protein [Spirillospora albida]